MSGRTSFQVPGGAEMDLVLAGLGSLSRFAGRRKSHVCSILQRCRDEIGCRHVAHVFLQRIPGREETYISVTYPGRWLLNYAIRNYFSVDPVIRDGERPSALRILNHVEGESAEVRAMLADAQAFGIGRSFVEIQVMPHSEYRGTVLFTFDVGPDCIEAYIAERRSHLLMAARKLHIDTMKARRLMPEGGEVRELDAEEVRCVSMIAEGCDYRAIAEALSWSEHRVAITVRSLCERLGCANPLHMVTFCLAQGLLPDMTDGLTRQQSAPLSTRVFPAKPH